MQRFLSILLILALIAIIPVSGFLVLAHREKNVSADVDGGRKVLQKLSSASVDDVQAILTERERVAQNALAQRERDDKVEATIQRIQNGELTYRKVLSKLYIAGDSLMAGLQTYGILDSKHIVAEVSASLFHLENNIDNIVAMHPPILLLHYGLNMIAEDEAHQNTFISMYKKEIETLKAALPNTRIIISLLFPVDTGRATAARFKYVNTYNRRLKQLCADEGIEYLDSASVFKGHDFYGADGIHLSATFYRDYWLPYLIRSLEITA